MPTVALNLDIVLRRTGNNLPLLRELIEIFLEETPEQLRSLRAAIDAGDFPKIHLFAHSIRGSVSYFGDDNTELAAIALENLGRNAERSGLETAWCNLSRTLGRLLESAATTPIPTASVEKR